MMRRSLLFAVYLLVTFIISFLFSGAGHGSFGPMLIFYSWARLFLEYGTLPEPSFWSAFYLVVIYLVLIFMATTLLIGYGKIKWYFVILFFHLMGIILSVLLVEHGHLVTRALIIGSYAAAIPVSFGYYFVDYKLLKKSRRGMEG